MEQSNTLNFMYSVLHELTAIAAQCATYASSWDGHFCRKEINNVIFNLDSPLRKQRNRKITIMELRMIPRDELKKLGFVTWSDNLVLIPLWIFNYIADGEELVTINNDTFIKGKDFIDLDTRRGCIAYGFVHQPVTQLDY